MKKRFLSGLLAAFLIVAVLSGCAQPKETLEAVATATPAPTATPQPTEVPTPEPTPEMAELPGGGTVPFPGRRMVALYGHPIAPVLGMMGDKLEAKKIAKSCGVPTVPGTVSPLRDGAEALEKAREFGFPVILKAAAATAWHATLTVPNANSI